MSEDLNKYTVNFPPESKIGTVDCSTVHNHYYGMAKSMKKRIRYISLISLTVVLASVGIALNPTNKKISQKDISDFEPIPIDKKKGGALLKGINFYNDKNFSLALEEFDASKDTSDFILFYKANCLMYLTQSTKARQYLDSIDENNILFKDEVEWLKALSYYYEKEIPNAIVILTDISMKDHKYKDEAGELLIEIYRNRKRQ